MGSYVRPTELEAALACLAAAPRTILAGGTDYYPARVGRPLDDDLLDLTGLAALKGIRDEGDHHRVGACVTWRELVDTPLPWWFDGAKQAARAVGGAQIQNTATLAGNICNASPAADGIPNWLALDVRLELAAPGRTRILPIGDFVLGNRRTALAPDELVTALLVPKRSPAGRSGFAKLGARRYLVISIAMLATVLELEGDVIAAARVAVGACSAAAVRLTALEAALAGVPLARAAKLPEPGHLAPLAPIDDVRGTAAYRMDAVLTLLRRELRP